MSIKDGIFVTNHVRLVAPLSPEDVKRAQQIRWQWVITFNRLKAQRGGGAEHAHALATAEQCIEVIDQILAANPTID